MYDDARDIYIEWLYTQKGIIPVPTVDSASSPQLSPDCLAPGGDCYGDFNACCSGLCALDRLHGTLTCL
jgi:hypothetical protein